MNIKFNPYGYWVTIVILVIIIFSLVNCEGDKSSTVVTTKDVKVEIPAKQGGFKEPTNQTELPPNTPDTVFIGGEAVYIPSKLDEELVKELEAANQTVDKYRALVDAARQREYSIDFEDSLVSINAKSTVFGKLDKTALTYKIKPQTVTVKETTITKTTVEKDKFGTLALAKYNYSLEPSEKSNIEIGAGLRFNKVSVLGTLNTNKQVGAGVIIEF